MVTRAYSYETGGAVLPVRVGGHPALDFCNTLAGWDDPAPKEYLSGSRELALWARDAGLVEPAAAERLATAEAPEVLARARTLRAAIRATALGGDGWHTIAAEAERGARVARLTPAGWLLPPERDDLPVLAVARAAAELLLSPHPPVRACPGTRCGWVFLDPRGRRRWCSMTTCGNRAKQRRRRAR